MSEGEGTPSTSSGQALVTAGKMPALRTATVALVVDRLFAVHAPGFFTPSCFPKRGKVRPEAQSRSAPAAKLGCSASKAPVTPQRG
jgi:hypothetical protein